MRFANFNRDLISSSVTSSSPLNCGSSRYLSRVLDKAGHTPKEVFQRLSHAYFPALSTCVIVNNAHTALLQKSVRIVVGENSIIKGVFLDVNMVYNEAILFSELTFLIAVSSFKLSLVCPVIMNRLTRELNCSIRAAFYIPRRCRAS